MNIQKPDASHSLTQAFDRTKKLLFEHFDWKVWFVFGFVSLVASCGRGGAGSNQNLNFNFNYGGGNPFPGGGTPAIPNPFQSMDLGLIIGVAVLALLVFAIVTGIAIYLGTKAEFSLFHKIATGDHDSPLLFIEEYNKRVNSLTLFRCFVMLPFSIPTICFFAYIGYYLYKEGFEFFTHLGIGAVILASLAGIFFALLSAFVRFFINNYISPIMYAKNQLAMEAFKEGFHLVKFDFGQSFLFLAIRFGFSVVATFALPFIGVLTCCVIIGLIPILNTFFLFTITAPFWVMMTAYSMYFIESFGDQYKMIQSLNDFQNYSGVAGINPSPYLGDGSGGAYAQPPVGSPPANRGITVQPTMDDVHAPLPPEETQPPAPPADESTVQPSLPPALPTEYKPQYSSPPSLPNEQAPDVSGGSADDQQPPYPPPPPPPTN